MELLPSDIQLHIYLQSLDFTCMVRLVRSLRKRIFLSKRLHSLFHSSSSLFFWRQLFQILGWIWPAEINTGEKAWKYFSPSKFITFRKLDRNQVKYNRTGWKCSDLNMLLTSNLYHRIQKLNIQLTSQTRIYLSPSEHFLAISETPHSFNIYSPSGFVCKFQLKPEPYLTGNIFELGEANGCPLILRHSGFQHTPITIFPMRSSPKNMICDEYSLYKDGILMWSVSWSYLYYGVPVDKYKDLEIYDFNTGYTRKITCVSYSSVPPVICPQFGIIVIFKDGTLIGLTPENTILWTRKWGLPRVITNTIGHGLLMVVTDDTSILVDVLTGTPLMKQDQLISDCVAVRSNLGYEILI